VLVGPALTLVALLAAGLLLRLLLAHFGGVGALRGAHLPWWGFLLLGTAICGVGLPRQAVCFAAGFGYGTLEGLALGFAANLLACAIGFGVARLLARRWLERRLAGRWSRRIGFLRANPFAAVLTLRLLPVGSSLLITLLSGAAGLRLWPFLVASAIGGLPQTVIFTLLGAGTRIGESAQIAVAVILFAASGACGLWLMRRAQAAGSDDTALR